MSQLTQFCRDTSHWINEWEIMFETAHSHGLVCQNLHTDTFFYGEHVSQCVRVGQNKGKFPLRHVLVCEKIWRIYGYVVLSRTRYSVRWHCCGRRRENWLWSVVLRGQSSWSCRAPPSLSPRVRVMVRSSHYSASLTGSIVDPFAEQSTYEEKSTQCNCYRHHVVEVIKVPRCSAE